MKDMKKRTLSLVLALSTLLSVLTVFATGASASGEETAEASSGGSEGSYVDLYVKDGLLALFDAYSMTASSEKLTEWRPLDLYGKAGYDDYLPLSTESGAYALSSGKSFEWRAGDGRLVLHRLEVSGGFDAYFFIFQESIRMNSSSCDIKILAYKRSS